MNIVEAALVPTTSFHFTPSKGFHTGAPKLIGLHGPARSGKDTVGQMLKDSFGVSTVFFAEPLKESARVMLGLSDEELYGDLKETVLPWLGKSPRQILQTLGTDWGRTMVNPDIWLILARRKIEALFEQGKSVAITDVRFENEADLVREMGGTMWHIYRKDRRSVERHASEAGIEFCWDMGDIRIDNNGTLEELSDIVHDCYYTT